MSDLPPPRDRRPQRIAVVPGDGIGVDVTREAVKVVEAAAERWELPLEIDRFPWGADHYLETGESLPDGALERLATEYSAIFMGAFGDERVPDMAHASDILLGTRFGLDLYVNLRPVKLLDARLCPLKGKGEEDVDFVVFRENTEGAYAGVGGNLRAGTAEEVATQNEIHTRAGVERIVRAAFDHAVAHDRASVVMADKSNAQRYAGDLWQRTFEAVRSEYPAVESWHLYIDALAMQMIRKPEMFDVIVTGNMFGDIATDLGAALQGGLGVAASANLHPGRTSMFEPVHGSAPKYAGTGRANPTGAILSAALMLDQLGHGEAAETIEEAVGQSFRADETTPDLGGSLTTAEVGDRIAAALTAAVPA